MQGRLRELPHSGNYSSRARSPAGGSRLFEAVGVGLPGCTRPEVEDLEDLAGASWKHDRGWRQPRSHVPSVWQFSARGWGNVSSASSCRIFCGEKGRGRAPCGVTGGCSFAIAPLKRGRRGKQHRLSFLISNFLLRFPSPLLLLLRLRRRLSSLDGELGINGQLRRLDGLLCDWLKTRQAPSKGILGLEGGGGSPRSRSG